MDNHNEDNPGFNPFGGTKEMIFQHFMEFEGKKRKEIENSGRKPQDFPVPEGLFQQMDLNLGFIPPASGKYPQQSIFLSKTNRKYSL